MYSWNKTVESIHSNESASILSLIWAYKEMIGLTATLNKKGID